MREFSAAVGISSSDGETRASIQPRMLNKKLNPDTVFAKFADGLADTGAGVDGDGKAIFGDVGSTILNGAKEALRQLTYWQMKNRAGVVGQKGLGPAIDRLAAEFPSLRLHLIGHSFGARVVSYALAGMSQSGPSPVKSITLLEGAYYGSLSATTCHSAGTALLTASSPASTGRCQSASPVMIPR
jgi:hypothetical protein